MYTAVELDARHALVKLNSKAIQCSLPISYRHGPFLADVVQRQVEQFEYGVIGWERTSGLGYFPQAHVQGLNGVGRVNRLADVGRVDGLSSLSDGLPFPVERQQFG